MLQYVANGNNLGMQFMKFLQYSYYIYIRLKISVKIIRKKEFQCRLFIKYYVQYERSCMYDRMIMVVDINNCNPYESLLDSLFTYIHNWFLQSGLLTQLLTPVMLCVLILCISHGTYSLKSPPNDRFFEELLMAILFTLRVFARNLRRGNRQRNTFRILF